MALFDRLRQRGVNPQTQARTLAQPQAQPQAQGVLPTINQGIPPAIPPTATTDRLRQLPQQGSVGANFQGGAIKKQFIADLPAKVQLDGIAQILAGQDSTSPAINNFVRGMAAKGKGAEEIRQAFIAQQKTSENPLVVV